MRVETATYGTVDPPAQLISNVASTGSFTLDRMRRDVEAIDVWIGNSHLQYRCE